MEKWARLFTSKKYGQMLVSIRTSEEGGPFISFLTNQDGVEVEFKMNLLGDRGWENAATLLNNLTSKQVEKSFDTVLEIDGEDYDD